MFRAVLLEVCPHLAVRSLPMNQSVLVVVQSLFKGVAQFSVLALAARSRVLVRLSTSALALALAIQLHQATNFVALTLNVSPDFLAFFASNVWLTSANSKQKLFQLSHLQCHMLSRLHSIECLVIRAIRDTHRASVRSGLLCALFYPSAD